MRIRRLKASSIAEIAIALSIIAICFAMGSRLFIQSARSTVQFQESIEQSEFQSLLFTSYLLDSSIYAPKVWEDKLTTVEISVSEKDSTRIEQLTLINSTKTNWIQTFIWSKKQ